MANYALLNCWSDLNKGDLGIMLATVDEIRRQDPQARIIGVSCYNENDPQFQECHKILRQSVPDIYPAIWGVLGLYIGGRYRKEFLCKIVSGIWGELQYLLLSLFPRKFSMLFLKKNERRTLEAILSCGAVFSKGGSVFSDYGTVRGRIALRRLCRFYGLLHRFGCKYYILGQSFGPVGERSSRYVNAVLKNARYVFIREQVCVREYPALRLSAENVLFSNDTAFLLTPQEVTPNPIDRGYHNVGITVREISTDADGYANAMVAFLTRLLREREDCRVHIFRQDSIHRVLYHTQEYLPQELCWLYGQMDAFIGTRLHSTIFAMRGGVPAIGIAYHGTKTQGIFENIGVPELVLQGPLSAEALWERYLYLTGHMDELRTRVAAGVERAQNEMRKTIHTIVEDAQKGEFP